MPPAAIDGMRKGPWRQGEGDEGGELMEEDALGNMKAALIGKYRYVILSRLTARDLRELQALVREETGADRAIDPEVRLRLMFRLRQYFPEDVLRREMAGIEALLLQLGPEDLRRDKS